MPVVIAVTPAARQPDKIEHVTLTDADFLREIAASPESESKDGPAFVPARLDPPYRADENVREISMLVIDFDHLAANRYDEAMETLAASGLKAFVWQTYSHRPPEDCRFRAALPFVEPMPLQSPAHWEPVWSALIAALGLAGFADRSCSDPSRLYYLPSRPPGAPPREFGFQDGPALDWRPIVASMGSPGASAPTPASNPTPPSPVTPAPLDPTTPGPFDMAEFRTRLATNQHDAQIGRHVARVLRGEAPELPPARRGADGVPREQAWREVTWQCASAALDLGQGDAREAILEFLRPAWTSEVAEDPQDPTPWEKIEERLDRAVQRMPEYKAGKRADWEAELARRAATAAAMAPVLDRAARTQIGSTDPGRYNLTDAGNAERLADRHRDQLRWVPEYGAWITWSGTHWRVDKPGHVIQRATVDTVRAMHSAPEEDPERARELSDYALKCESHRTLEAMAMRARALLSVSMDELDADPFRLNCSNGVVDLRTGALESHRPDGLHTRLARVEYRPDATCPTWLAFLTRIFDGNADVIEYVRRALGYSLTGDTREHVFFVAHGSGANGKSTMLNTVASALGDYASQGAPDLLVKKRNDGHLEIADLQGARFVICPETEPGQSLDTALIKQITGGERVKGRFMFRDFFAFRPTCKLWLGTNHRPHVKGQDDGIWRRNRSIPFSVTIPESERDKALGEKLAGELEGIFAWLVHGSIDWWRVGLGMPPEIRAAVEEYREDEDILAEFLEDRCDFGADFWCSRAEVYNAYVSWAELNGEHVLSARGLCQAMLARAKARGIAPYRESSPSRTRGWQGMRLRHQSVGEQISLVRTK